jgi:eukaryotic-like serine/threonine-protein kinase
MDAPQPSPTPCLEMAHVLFMDIVAYSTLPMDHQQRLLGELQEAVRNTPEFTRAQAEDQLIRLPTGDGMALVFFHDPEAPVRCAVELSRTLRQHPNIKLRMGIHSGPVYRVADINANRNVAGGGINIAQRVMDCGDAGHILVSRASAEVLLQLSAWRDKLHDLGEAEVKHGARIHLYNLYTDDAGNPVLPNGISGQAAPLRPAPPKTKKRRLTPAVALVAAALVAASTVAAWLLHAHKAHALSATDTIVVGDFANKTGDPIFDSTVRRGLIVQLDQSPFLSLVSANRMQTALHSMGRPADSPLTPDLTRELCERIGSKAYLTGSIEGSNGQYVLSLRAVNCRTGDRLANERVQAVAKDDVLRAISELSQKAREDLGESTGSIRKFDISLEANTPSLEAFQAYASGMNLLEGRGQYPQTGGGKTTELSWYDDETIEQHVKAAVPFFQQAVHWDPSFALGYSALVASYLSTPSRTIVPYILAVPLAFENATKAYQLRDRVGQRQRFVIEDTYYEEQAHEVQEAQNLYATWEQTYPRDAQPHLEQAWFYYNTGKYEKFLKELQEAQSLEPETRDYWYSIHVLLYLNRLPEAENLLKEYRAEEPDSALVHRLSYDLAFLRGDAAAMSREMHWAASKPFVSDFLDAEVDTAAYFGKFREARELSRRAMQSAKENNDVRRAWGALAGQVVREVLVGNTEEGRRARAAFDDYPPSSQRVLALALAYAGETIKPRSFAEETAKKESHAADDLFLTSIRAQVSVNQGNPEKAVELLASVEPYRFVDSDGADAVYIRGYANLAIPHMDAARADFQEILDHRGSVGNNLVGALAHVGLARACALQGEMVGAKRAYKEFFTLWRDADPDVPLLNQAKAEYAKLK